MEMQRNNVISSDSVIFDKTQNVKLVDSKMKNLYVQGLLSSLEHLTNAVVTMKTRCPIALRATKIANYDAFGPNFHGLNDSNQ